MTAGQQSKRKMRNTSACSRSCSSAPWAPSGTNATRDHVAAVRVGKLGRCIEVAMELPQHVIRILPCEVPRDRVRNIEGAIEEVLRGEYRSAAHMRRT